MMLSDLRANASLTPDCRAILNSVADVIVLVTADGRFVACNRAAERFFGLGRDALLGTALGDWCGPHQHDGSSGEDFVCATLDAAHAGAVQTEWCYHVRGRTGTAELSIGLADEGCEMPLMVVSIRDVSVRKRVESRLRYQSRVLKMLVQGEPLEQVLLTLALEVGNDSPAVRCMILRLSEDRQSLLVSAAPGLPDEVVTAIDGSVVESDAAAWLNERIIAEDLEGQPIWRAHSRRLRAAGLRACWSEPIRESRGGTIGVLCIFLTEPHFPSESELAHLIQAADLASIAIEQALIQAQLRASEQRFRSLVMHIENMAIQGYDAHRRVILWKKGSEKIYGYTEAEALGQQIEDLIIPAAMCEQVIDDIEHWVRDDVRIPSGEIELRRKNGSLISVFSTHEILRLPPRGPEMYCVDVDLTERKKAEHVIWFQANYDLLTGLANRHLFMDRLRQQVLKSERSGEAFALLYMDLDGFKAVNDKYGHHLGDQLLVEAARRMQSCVRKSDTLARLGGDEFTLIVTSRFDRESLVRVADYINRQVATTYMLDEHEAQIAVSIGIAIFPVHGRGVDELIRAADKAMYDAKQAGRNSFAFAR